MKIMSFNTQHCENFKTGIIDFEIFAQTIKDLDPDIVGLNEMRGDGVSPDYTPQVEKLAELTGMKYYFFGPAIDIRGKGLYGNGFLSKVPIISAEKIMIPDPDPKLFVNDYYETRCILKILLKGGITVLVTHFGLNSDEHECAVRAIFENLCDEKCILMGDFNVTPSNPILNIIRDKMVDTADFFTEEQLSFPSDNPNRKIDYIFVSHDIEVISAEIPGLVVSDHRPYTATIKV